VRRRFPPGSRVQLTWFGHSAFQAVSPGGKVLLVDPWLENPKAPPKAREINRVDLILISHGHSDHLGNAVEIARRTGATVLAIYEVCQYLASAGVARTQALNKGGSFTLSGIRITMVDARHSSAIEDRGAMISGGEAAGFVMEFENGTTLYHAGDTSLFMDMKLIGQMERPDVVLLPIGGLYTMGPREAAKACELLNPKRIIGMHYGTFPALSGTPAELRKCLPPRMKGKLLELEVGVPVEV